MPASQSVPPPVRPSVESLLLWAMFIACLAYSVRSAAIGWNNTLLGPHGFRQTQTAITTYFMLHGRPWLVYETPVLGAPWAIPFEFPLYQWAVALAAMATGMPLDQAGRLIGELFFYATLVPAYVLLARFDVRPRHRLIFLSLLLVSPQYLYWSRSFMIESTVLFCSMAYLACAVRAVPRGGVTDLAGAVLFGALAAMVKITTFFVFLLAAGLYLCVAWWQAGAAWFTREKVIRFALFAVLIAVVPVTCGVAWTQFTNAVTLRNPLAASFLTPAELESWSLGTAAQRASSRFWLILLLRTLPDLIGHAAVLFAAAALLIVDRRRLIPFGICVGLFLSAPLSFANLHMVHDYYAYANGLFVIAAIGWCGVGYLERGDQWRWLGALVLAAAIAGSLWRYERLYLPVQRENVTRWSDVAQTIQRSTAPEQVLFILGLDWRAELPYYARRRSLMDRDNRPPDDPIMRQAIANLGDEHIGAMVVCSTAVRQRELIEAWVQALGLSPLPRRVTGCEIYTRPT